MTPYRPPETLFPIVYHAWPDARQESRATLLEEWGWRVVGERRPASQVELAVWLYASAYVSEHSDGPWNQGYAQADGWQCVFSAWGHFGGLREIYTDFGFPVLEWVDHGDDQSFDIDILLGMPALFFSAHTRGGEIDASIEPVQGQIVSARDAGQDGVLLLQNVPEALQPRLRGLPQRLTFYNSLHRTLAALGIPEQFHLGSPLPHTSSYLEVRDIP